jgi:hypothetical protein
MNGPGEGSSDFCISGLLYSVFSPAAGKSACPRSEFDLRRPRRNNIKKINEAKAEIPTPAPIAAFAPVLMPLLGGGVGITEGVELAVTVTTLPVPDCDNPLPTPPPPLDVIDTVTIVIEAVFDDPAVVIVEINVVVVDTRLMTELVYVLVLTAACPLRNVEVEVSVVHIETHEYAVPVQVETGIALGARAYFSSWPLITSSTPLRGFTCGTVVVDVTV